MFVCPLHYPVVTSFFYLPLFVKRISAAEVVYLRSAGFSIPEISAAVSTSPEKVKSILTAKGAYRRPRVSKLAEFDQEIRALTKAGVSDTKIALFFEGDTRHLG